MSQLPLFQPTLWSVAELTRYLRELLEGDGSLQDLWVQGEVSNFSRPSSGHLYFTLKDPSSSLRCVMWRAAAARQAYLPRDGESIEVHGSLSIYEAGGQYQLYADVIRPAGEGALFQEFLRLKDRLEAEGLFALERKRPIPRWPAIIGIVTSPTGAALRDMLNTIRRRYSLAKVVIAPASVQGADAPAEIVRALDTLNRLGQPDVILLARGGGSIEDLWAFNDERVARAIAASTIPVISGVGHETDFTIADFVADLRAPTPTAAAELATPNRPDLELDLAEVSRRLHQAAEGLIEEQRRRLDHLHDRLWIRSPLTRVRTDRQRLDDLSHRAAIALNHQMQLERARLGGLQQQLAALSPLAVLTRGYAIVARSDTGQIVHSVNQVLTGDRIIVRLADGSFPARAGQP